MAAEETKKSEIVEVKPNGTVEVNDENTLVLSRTYDFEGDKISSIDFSGLEDVTAETMIKANKVLTASGDIAILPENSLHYALVVAADCTSLPIEFYKKLKPRDAIKVKNKVTGFFYGEDLD